MRMHMLAHASNLVIFDGRDEFGIAVPLWKICIQISNIYIQLYSVYNFFTRE